MEPPSREYKTLGSQPSCRIPPSIFQVLKVIAKYVPAIVHIGRASHTDGLRVEVSQNEGPLFGSPSNMDHTILESISGRPVYGNPRLLVAT